MEVQVTQDSHLSYFKKALQQSIRHGGVCTCVCVCVLLPDFMALQLHAHTCALHIQLSCTLTNMCMLTHICRYTHLPPFSDPFIGTHTWISIASHKCLYAHTLALSHTSLHTHKMLCPDFSFPF